MSHEEYEKPRLTVLGVFGYPVREAFKLFVEGVRFFNKVLGTRVSDLEPNEDARYQQRQRNRRE